MLLLLALLYLLLPQKLLLRCCYFSLRKPSWRPKSNPTARTVLVCVGLSAMLSSASHSGAPRIPTTRQERESRTPESIVGQRGLGGHLSRPLVSLLLVSSLSAALSYRLASLRVPPPNPP